MINPDIFLWEIVISNDKGYVRKITFSGTQKHVYKLITTSLTDSTGNSFKEVEKKEKTDDDFHFVSKKGGIHVYKIDPSERRKENLEGTVL